jgi:hypothetical protein
MGKMFVIGNLVAHWGVKSSVVLPIIFHPIFVPVLKKF